MDILTVLNKLAQMENEVSKLYEWFSDLFVLDEKASAFFRKLAEEEQSHYDLVRYQERIVRKAPNDFAPVDVNMEAIGKMLSAIAAVRKTSPGIRDVIRFALDIETEIAEQYAATVMDQSNKEFAALMKSLTASLKEDHYKQLIKFAGSYD